MKQAASLHTRHAHTPPNACAAQITELKKQLEALAHFIVFENLYILQKAAHHGS